MSNRTNVSFHQNQTDCYGHINVWFQEFPCLAWQVWSRNTLTFFPDDLFTTTHFHFRVTTQLPSRNTDLYDGAQSQAACHISPYLLATCIHEHKSKYCYILYLSVYTWISGRFNTSRFTRPAIKNEEVYVFLLHAHVRTNFKRDNSNPMFHFISLKLVPIFELWTIQQLLILIIYWSDVLIPGFSILNGWWMPLFYLRNRFYVPSPFLHLFSASPPRKTYKRRKN